MFLKFVGDIKLVLRNKTSKWSIASERHKFWEKWDFIFIDTELYVILKQIRSFNYRCLNLLKYISMNMNSEIYLC